MHTALRSGIHKVSKHEDARVQTVEGRGGGDACTVLIFDCHLRTPQVFLLVEIQVVIDVHVKHGRPVNFSTNTGGSAKYKELRPDGVTHVDKLQVLSSVRHDRRSLNLDKRQRTVTLRGSRLRVTVAICRIRRGIVFHHSDNNNVRRGGRRYTVHVSKRVQTHLKNELLISGHVLKSAKRVPRINFHRNIKHKLETSTVSTGTGHD